MTSRPSEELDPQLLLGRRFVLDLEELGALWGRCFGTAPRDWAWMQRKFHREFFRDDLSTFLLDADGHLAGFFAVGDASAPVVHGIGLGVDPKWRGRGLGRELIRASLDAIRALGSFEALECEVMPGPSGVYEGAGLERLSSHAHLAFEGRATTSAQLEPTDAPPGARFLWRQRIWERTPLPERRVFSGTHGRFGLSREASAWLVHWFEGSDLPAALESLLAKIASEQRVLLYGLTTEGPDYPRLIAQGGHPAQRFSLYRCAL